MIAHDENIFIDPEIPLEMQISFLRQRTVHFQLDVFEVLKEKLGHAGMEIFKAILMRVCGRVVEMTRGLDFQTLASLAGFSDRMLGLRTEMDYTRPDEFQYSISYCPYLEECKRRGLDMEFCHIFEDVYSDAIGKSIGELTEPARMCDGDSKCIFKMQNTFGK